MNLSIFVWIVFCSMSFLQSYSQTIDLNNICNQIKEIDTNEFKVNFVKKEKLFRTTRYKKNNGKLIIKTLDTLIIFKDYYDNGDAIDTYSAVFEDTIKKWVWVEEKGLHTVTYFLINTKTSNIDTLIGPPQKYEDKIICLEDVYTDGTQFVQIYQIELDKLNLLRKFSLRKCGLSTIERVYLNNKTLYIANSWGKRWKVKVIK